MSQPDSASAVAPHPNTTLTVEEVGVVTQHFSRLGVASIRVSTAFPRGVTLLGRTHGRNGELVARTVLASSVEFEKTPVESAVVGQEVGVQIGHPLFPVGTTVYRVV